MFGAIYHPWFNVLFHELRPYVSCEIGIDFLDMPKDISQKKPDCDSRSSNLKKFFLLEILENFNQI